MIVATVSIGMVMTADAGTAKARCSCARQMTDATSGTEGRTMTEREKVIYDIERCICHVPDACKDCSKYGGDNAIRCMEELLTDALSLLKAHEPVKPFVTGNGHTFEEAETWWYECGNCNEPIDPNDQFCRHCGRAVKWDG